jgi:hypothetical protein
MISDFLQNLIGGNIDLELDKMPARSDLES